MEPIYDIIFGDVEYFDTKQLYRNWHVIRLNNDDDIVRFKLLDMPTVTNNVLLAVNFQMGTGIFLEDIRQQNTAVHGRFLHSSFETLWNRHNTVRYDKRYDETSIMMNAIIDLFNN